MPSPGQSTAWTSLEGWPAIKPELSRTRSAPRILMLSMYDNEQYLLRVVASGGVRYGYVLKSVADHDLVEACHAAMCDESFLYSGAMSALIRNHRERLRRGERVPANVLTPREDEVLKLIAEDTSFKASPKP